MLNRVKNALKMSFGTSKIPKIARLRWAIPKLDRFLVGDHKTSQIQDFQNFGGGMGGGGGVPQTKKNLSLGFRFEKNLVPYGMGLAPTI